MDYSALLDLVTDLGYRLAISGAETFRVEESVNRILGAYGIASEVFAIPNCITVSIETPDGTPMTRMRRVEEHGNDLDSVEKYSNLSRKICAEAPEISVARQWLKETDAARVRYGFLGILLGHFLGSGGFCVLYGGSWVDGLCAGLCGLLVAFVDRFMTDLKANSFFRILCSAFVLAIAAYGLGAAGVTSRPDSVVIGALMLLVPGLLFTNAMRDIIFGDTNSGTNRVVQVILIALAIALGTGAAWNVAGMLLPMPVSAATLVHSFFIECIACLTGCIGFSIIFNIHGPGGLLCAMGGILCWGIYRLALNLGCTDVTACFWGTLAAACYAEKMARVRKYPAISYLVVSIFPLIPGAGVYYTMHFAVRGEMDAFVERGWHTAAVAGGMAVSILLISTTVRLYSVWHRRRQAKKA